MKFILPVLLIFSFSYSHAQSNRYLKVSGGRVLFGTGDVPGYGIYTEYSSILAKQKTSYWKHFQLGGELGFETGATQPASLNPPPSEFQKFFYHVSNTSLHAKLTYYPIGTPFLKGLHVAIGPTVGYSLSSRAGAGLATIYPDGTILQATYLTYNNYLFVGYKISAGYEYYFRKWLIGARLDWSNTQKGDINTMYGAKLGWHL